jgi:hypothetical protein
LGSARLLKLEAALVDCCDGVELVDGGVDAEVLAGSQGQVFQVFDVGLTFGTGVGGDGGRKVDSSKFVYELC